MYDQCVLNLRTYQDNAPQAITSELCATREAGIQLGQLLIDHKLVHRFAHVTISILYYHTP
jgi:hypothetical protein